jgi:hypothetical protein
VEPVTDHHRSEHKVAERERRIRLLQEHARETLAKGVVVREHRDQRTGMHAKCRAEIAAGRHGCTGCCWQAEHDCEGARTFDAWVSEGA